MNEIKAQLEAIIGLQESEWEVMKGRFQKKSFDAKARILSEGGVAKELFFICSGLIRAYHLEDGKEVNTYFACDGQFILNFASFVTQSPSMEFMETVEASEVYAISYDQLTELYALSPKFERIGRYLAEQNYLCLLDRTLTMQTKTAKQKYLDFIETMHPKIVQRLPQHHIASFLGIAPESLSRIRRELLVS